MNLWWPLLVVLGCAWVLPLLGTRHVHLGWPYFVGCGCLWAVVLVYVGPLYDWGTDLLRKLGQTRMADWRERMKPRLMGPARVALLIMAAISFVFALL